MELKKKALAIVKALKQEYPDSMCSLEHRIPHEFLISTRLSAQCTDKRVNQVADVLFCKYPTLESLDDASQADIEDIIRPCGLFHTKARDIKATVHKLLTEFDGKLPDTMEALLSLPGVGRKTANLMLGELFGQPAIVADTHCIRLSNRLGLVDSQNAYRVELALRDIIPPKEQLHFCHRLIFHGRAVCKARSPACKDCRILHLCAHGEETEL